MVNLSKRVPALSEMRTNPAPSAARDGPCPVFLFLQLGALRRAEHQVSEECLKIVFCNQSSFVSSPDLRAQLLGGSGWPCWWELLFFLIELFYFSLCFHCFHGSAQNDYLLSVSTHTVGEKSNKSWQNVGEQAEMSRNQFVGCWAGRSPADLAVPRCGGSMGRVTVVMPFWRATSGHRMPEQSCLWSQGEHFRWFSLSCDGMGWLHGALSSLL